MDQREQMNQPEAEQARVERQRHQAERIAQEGPSIRAESIIEARGVIDRIEERLSSGTRVPFKNHLSMVNVGELLNLTSELRSALPDAVQEAAEIIRDKQQIELTARQRAQEKTNQANADAKEKIESAEAQAKKTLEDARARAMEIEQQARATAERILMQANADAQMLTEENEIVRRAHARAKEIFDQVQMDTDGMYKHAYTEVNKMLSGATAALNRSALELAGLRDQLLSAGSGDSGNAR
ncbi:MAG: hypothetical protein IKU34_00115 [Clostridia bacterium]|nr:hypothetical protein [Clostridia bacterium]